MVEAEAARFVRLSTSSSRERGRIRRLEGQQQQQRPGCYTLSSSSCPSRGDSKPREEDQLLKQQPPNYYYHWGAKRARSGRLPCCPPNNNNWRDWANLDDGPAGLIAERVLAYGVADYLRFRAVCCPWRRCSVDPRVHNSLDRRYHPWRWLMLRDHPLPPAPNNKRRRFLNTATGECIQVDIPELCDHQVLSLTREGLLVLLHHDKNHLRLLNPLTRHLTQLPPLPTLLPPDLLSDHAGFTAWGSGILNDDSTVLLYFNLQCTLGIAKPDDVCWTQFEFIPGMRSAISIFAGRFYCVTGDGVMVLEVEGQQPPRLELAAKLCMRISGMSDTVHLVDSAGELMLVHRRFSRHRNKNNVAKRRYDTYRVDLDAGTLCRVNNSFGGGRHALFIGIYCSLCVPIEVFPAGSIHGDTIYLSLDIDESDKTGTRGASHLRPDGAAGWCSHILLSTASPCAIPFFDRSNASLENKQISTPFELYSLCSLNHIFHSSLDAQANIYSPKSRL